MCGLSETSTKESTEFTMRSTSAAMPTPVKVSVHLSCHKHCIATMRSCLQYKSLPKLHQL